MTSIRIARALTIPRYAPFEDILNFKTLQLQLHNADRRADQIRALMR